MATIKYYDKSTNSYKELPISGGSNNIAISDEQPANNLPVWIDTSVATDEVTLQPAVLETFSGVSNVTASRAFTAADFGKTILIKSAGVNFTLPDALLNVEEFWEIALVSLIEDSTATLVSGGSWRLLNKGEGIVTKNVQMPSEIGNILVLKRLDTDLVLASGNCEVVDR